MQLIKEIARGGFGVVLEVEENGSRFALKYFSPPQPMLAVVMNKARLRFAREVTIQKGISHQNILPILRSDLGNVPPWFMMPLADEDYTKQIERDRLSGNVSLDPLIDILAGLEELHRLGYVHRDLKPQNILSLNARWMLSDFGLALPPDRESTKVTSTKEWWGTEQYMPPEQYSDFRASSPAVDIYAFGCILHDLAGGGGTLRIPYGQHTCPGKLGPIIERCTASNPDDRFPNVAALRSALVMALRAPAHAVTTAAGNHWIERLGKSATMSRDEWRDLITYVEKHLDEKDASTVLEAIDLEQIDNAHANAHGLFVRLADVMCRWIQEGGFQWNFCDVLAARLMRMYDFGDVAIQSAATIAALEMGVGHNRWHVMRTFLRMADPNISDDLADRLAIEFFALDGEAVRLVERVESVLHTKANLHPRLLEALEEIRIKAAAAKDAPDEVLPF